MMRLPFAKIFVVIALSMGLVGGVLGSGLGLGPQGVDERLERLDSIAGKLSQRSGDDTALLTEAFQLCGFTIWNEDKVRLAGPSGEPALHLAITDAEIRGYLAMYRSGHAVKLGDLINSLDLPYQSIGGKGSCGVFLKDWLQTGVVSSNPSSRATNGFLRSLAIRHATLADNAFDDNSELDPIQALVVLRIMTEEMGAPLRKAIAKVKPPTLLASLTPKVLQQEAPGWAEDGFVGGITGMFGALSDVLDKEESAYGSYAKGVEKANAIASISKFILTYTFLRGEIRIDAPGNPLIRTKDRTPGDRRTLIASFKIDGTKVTDWMKDNRKLVALAGLDIDMPKSGALKGIETEWRLDQSRQYATKQLVQVVGQVDISKVRSDANGEARVTLEGKPQLKALDPTKVKAHEKAVWVDVTPQVKSTEMQQDIVDAITGAIGIKEGKPGPAWLTIIMECLYRMKWSGTTSLKLGVRDWQDAENVAQVLVEVHGRGFESNKDKTEFYEINRKLEATDVSVDMMGGNEVPQIDKETLDKMSPAMRQQMEDMMKKYAEMAKSIQFIAQSVGTWTMFIDDQHVRTFDASDCIAQMGRTIDRKLGSKSVPGNGNDPNELRMSLSMKLDLPKKVALVTVNFPIDVHSTYTTQIGRKPAQSTENEDWMDIFDRLEMQGNPNPSKGITVPLKVTPTQGDGRDDYNGTATIPFSFGDNGKFRGTVMISFSITRKSASTKGSKGGERLG